MTTCSSYSGRNGCTSHCSSHASSGVWCTSTTAAVNNCRGNGLHQILDSVIVNGLVRGLLLWVLWHLWAAVYPQWVVCALAGLVWAGLQALVAQVEISMRFQNTGVRWP